MRAPLFVFIFIFLPGGHAAFSQKVKRVKIGMCSDVHLPTMHDAEWRLTKFLDSMKTAKPDFIIELGDFGTPARAYAPLFELWNEYPGTKYHVIGNHEMDGGFSMDAALAYRKMASSYYSFEMNGFHFIVLDGNDKKFPEENGYRQYIGPIQQAWLKKELDAARQPIVIFSHQGIGDKNGIDNKEEVRAILEQHNVNRRRAKIIACFNGHSHFDAAEQINGIWYVTINSMAYKWLGEEYPFVRYSEEVDQNFKWIKFTAPYKDPLYTVVEISSDGYIRMSGKKSEWVGPSPWELRYPEEYKSNIIPSITERALPFK
ncbi:MAG TPA: metallophosphoesterase family protein [Cyclobacteriaceae bacterium]|nr:metallophosphoesterase family protein [Cyclobacteriaceae bacterium]